MIEDRCIKQYLQLSNFWSDRLCYWTPGSAVCSAILVWHLKIAIFFSTINRFSTEKRSDGNKKWRTWKLFNCHPPFPYFLPSPFLTYYRPHMEGRDPIWGDDWSHSPFIRQSPSWGFLGFISAVRQMPGDLCTTPRIISLSPLSLATDVTDATLGVSGIWLGTRTGAGGTATLTESFLAAAHGSMDNRIRGQDEKFSA